MKVEVKPGGAADADVVARVDETLEPGEVVRDGRAIAVGPLAGWGLDALRAAAALAARAVRRNGGRIAWPAETEDDVRAVVEGTAYGVYDPGLRKRGYGDGPELTVLLDADESLRPFAERQAIVSEHVGAARDLSNLPPNELTPVALGEHATAEGLSHLAGETFGRDQIVGMGMGAFAAVAAGSAREPQLIVLRYDPPSSARNDVTLGLVGKAITFDSGGISLKQPLRMQDMKGDMAGGAAVIEGIRAIAELGLPVRAVGVVASTENVQGSQAFKPGDILRASNGKTIEVINTDAEGRLVLADALHHARGLGATHVVDFATLTGVMRMAFGDLYAGYYVNDDDWARKIDAASQASGDLAWRMPLHPRYRRYVDSDFADMKNGSELREGGPALAAEFLREFAGEGPWAHVDMAGPGYVKRKRPDYVLDQGGTGYGVRLIVELAQRLAEPVR
jgi:leucyl aminopeptidase